FRASRSAAPARGGSPVVHQLHARFSAALGEYAQIPVERHKSGGSYIRHIHGTVHLSGVKWVRGILLAPDAAIPATPPAHAAEANLVLVEGQTHYDFCSRKDGRNRLHSGLGPAQPGERLRLVVWACVASPAPARGRTTSARRTARRQERVFLADELPVFEFVRWTKGDSAADRPSSRSATAKGTRTKHLASSGADLVSGDLGSGDPGSGDPGPAALGGATAFGLAPAAALTTGTSLVEPTGTIAVPLVPPGNAVKCKLSNVTPTAPNLTRVAAIVFRTRIQAENAMNAGGPNGGSVTAVSPSASSATCLAVGAQLGPDNFVVAWAQTNLPGVWVVCEGSGRQITVT
ncbi:MAG: hypothetical protein ACKO3P_03230, partial [Planctomycetaceae bacterium]